MTTLEKTQKVLNLLEEDGLITGFKRILHKEIEGKEIIVIALYNNMEDSKIIKGVMKLEFPNITSFTCVKEVVAFTIKS